MNHQGPRKADALPHASRELARIGRFETVQPDQVDRGQRALADFRPRHALRFEADRHIFEYGQPWEQCEALEHHRDARGRSKDRLPKVAQVARARFRQARDQSQQRRFARSRPPQQADDLALDDFEVHAFQYQKVRPVRFRKRLRYFVTSQ
jgi:hypothetical protein